MNDNLDRAARYMAHLMAAHPASDAGTVADAADDAADAYNIATHDIDALIVLCMTEYAVDDG